MDAFKISQDFSKQLKIAKADYLYGEHVTISKFNHFLQLFEKIELNALDNDQKKKAFFINVYNGFTNYLILKEGLKGSMKDNPDFFKTEAILLGGYVFSLDDIEHGLLRKNARNHIKPNDKRLKFQVNNLDYRIHFALNCGAKSCPPIASYSLKKLEQELNLATTVFVENEFIVNFNKKTIECSELFLWYREDFRTKFLNDPKYKDFTIIKRPYNWSL